MKMNFRNVQLLLTLLRMTGISALFIPFTFGISPLIVGAGKIDHLPTFF